MFWILCKICGFHGGDYENVIFWDVTLRGCCKNLHFGGSYRIHHQGDKNGFARNNVSRNKQLRDAVKKYYGYYLCLHHQVKRGKHILSWVPQKELTIVTGQPMSCKLELINTGDQAKSKGVMGKYRIKPVVKFAHT
jgi:hypothetical protein